MRNFTRFSKANNSLIPAWNSAALIRKSSAVLHKPSSQRLFIGLGVLFLVASIGTASIPWSVSVPSNKGNRVKSLSHSITVPVTIDEASPAPSTQGITVREGYRAVAVSVDARTGVEGYAQPGSFVDVYYTYVDNTGRLQSTVIAENAHILSATGQLFEAPFSRGLQKQISSGSVILEVTAEESMKIITGTEVALISLVLRSNDDHHKTTPVVATSEDVAPLKTEKGSQRVTQRTYCPSTSRNAVKVGTPILPAGYQIPKFGATFLNQCRPFSVL